MHLIVHLKTRESRSRFFATRNPLLMDAFGVCYNHLNKSVFVRLTMGFMSFNENYYRRKLEECENKILSDTEIREAKQLLKVLDDLTDEGYTNLNDTMEADSV